MFPSLLEGAKIFKNNLFLLRFKETEGLSRFAFSVSKKVAKRAVVRNKMRRYGYGTLVKYLDKIKSGVLAHFSFREEPKDWVDVDKNLAESLKKTNLFK